VRRMWNTVKWDHDRFVYIYLCFNTAVVLRCSHWLFPSQPYPQPLVDFITVCDNRLGLRVGLPRVASSSLVTRARALHQSTMPPQMTHISLTSVFASSALSYTSSVLPFLPVPSQGVLPWRTSTPYEGGVPFHSHASPSSSSSPTRYHFSCSLVFLFMASVSSLATYHAA
jgi:hypothetical protein